jgi:hypothetical protein
MSLQLGRTGYRWFRPGVGVDRSKNYRFQKRLLWSGRQPEGDN